MGSAPTRTVLLYGANGYSGRLIAQELVLQRNAGPAPGSIKIILAGRNAEALDALGSDLGLPVRVFGLENMAALRQGIKGVTVVINAAGPFYTSKALGNGERIAAAAILEKCHYVDVSGEADSYLRMIALGPAAANAKVALIPSAGFWAAASDLLLDAALRKLAGPAFTIGTIRIAMAQIRTPSRGSVETVLNALRTSVITVRRAPKVQPPKMILWHEPAGLHEHHFHFEKPDPGSNKPVRAGIAVAASLVDTLAARRTVARAGQIADRIVSYVEAPRWARLAYSGAAQASPLLSFAAVRKAALCKVQLLPEGPTKAERDAEPHKIVLHVENQLQKRLIDWRWKTPNVYDFTARLCAATALAATYPGIVPGLRTPAELLRPRGWDLLTDSPADCTLDPVLGGP